MFFSRTTTNFLGDAAIYRTLTTAQLKNDGVTKRQITSHMVGIPPDLPETEHGKNLETNADNRNDLLQNKISTSQSFPDTQSLPKLSPRGTYFMN